MSSASNPAQTVPSAEFWDYNRRLLKLDAEDRIYFTAEGRRTYRPLLAKWGYALENVKTREQFRQVMLTVNAYELEENTTALREALEDPDTTPAEREMVLALLGQTADAPGAAHEPDASHEPDVTHEPSTPAAAQVIAVDFRKARNRPGADA